jgi:hypothetical protein
VRLVNNDSVKRVVLVAAELCSPPTCPVKQEAFRCARKQDDISLSRGRVGVALESNNIRLLSRNIGVGRSEEVGRGWAL